MAGRRTIPRVICANRTPDHTTIARFRVRHETALSRTFTQILGMCARAGLVSVGVVALDGTALAADASRSATRSHEQIRQEVDRMLAEAAEVDAREDELHGDARGDELPAELVDRRSRLARLRRCREEIEAEQAKAEMSYQENLRWRAEWEAAWPQARRSQADPARARGAFKADDQHDRPGLAGDPPGGPPTGAGL
jgi:hypothetical protein